MNMGKGLVGGRTVAFWLVAPTVQMQEGKKEGTKLPTKILPGKKIDSWKISVREISEKFD